MILLREATFPGGGGVAPGAVVLRDKGAGSGHRYVVHYRNDEYGGHYQGLYTDDRAKADAEFRRRVDSCRATERRVATP